MGTQFLRFNHMDMAIIFEKEKRDDIVDHCL